MEKVKTTTKQRNILFVDSDKELIRNLKDYLESHEVKEKHSLDFTFAGSTKEALKKIAELKIDLIVLEILLPVINGYYLLEALKKEGNSIPIVVYTKLKGPQDMAKLAASEVDNVFIKQLVKMEDMIQMIAKGDSMKANLDKVVVELQSQIKALSEGESQTQLKVVQCPRCSMILSRDSHFCNNCGQQIFKKSKGLKATAMPNEEEAKAPPADAAPEAAQKADTSSEAPMKEEAAKAKKAEQEA